MNSGIKKYYERARQLYQMSSSHDFSHIERVFKMALYLGEKEGANLEILGIAALFHDIGRPAEEQSQGAVCHALAGAQQTRQLLIEDKEALTLIEAVYHCIATHRYRDNDEPQTIEAQCLYDADKLDSLGAVGVARAYLWLGERGGTVYVPREIWEQTDFNSNSPEDDSLQREWHIKLQYLQERIYTNTARQIAQKRAETMGKFLNILELEINECS